MGFYDGLIKEEIFEKELDYKGQKKTVYFKRLTAGERINLSRGQKMLVGNKSKEHGVEVDLGEFLERTHRYLLMCNVDSEGKRIFKKIEEVQALPEDLVSALQKLADEALVEKDQEDLGNSSSETSS